MIAEELINPLVPQLQSDDPAEKALYQMETFHLSELPVVDHDRYRGLLHRRELLSALNPADNAVSDFLLTDSEIFALPHQHFYDVLKIAEDHALQTVPILDEDRHFLGVITISDTLAVFAQNYASQEPGGSLVLSMPERDYSLSEISRLVESNAAKIVSSYVSSHPYEPDYIKLNLKINRTDLSRIIATFERFSYTIVARFQQEDATNTDKERYDMLMKYLNI